MHAYHIFGCMCICAKLLHSCLTLCDLIHCRPPGSPVHGISRQEYLSGFSCPPPGDLPNPGIKPTSLMSPALAGGFFATSSKWEAHSLDTWYQLDSFHVWGPTNIHVLTCKLSIFLIAFFLKIILNCMGCLCALDINPFSVTLLANIFSHSVSYLFICWLFHLLRKSF